jgi:1-deoxy-D-xylulose-5-phosphate reductoisomerase
VPDAGPVFDWSQAMSWDFGPLDPEAFPAVPLAFQVGQSGGTAPAVYNAANEECVEAFLGGRLPFSGIVDTVAAVVGEHGEPRASALSLTEVLDAETWARTRARELATAAAEARA